METSAWDLLDRKDKTLILKGIARGKALAPPRALDLEWSRRQWLPDAAHDRRPGAPPDEMDLYTLEKIFGEMEDAGVKGLVLGGEGDPLEHRSTESLLKRLERAPFRLCSLATGGDSLRGRVAELLARVLRGRLEVRLEAVTEESYTARLGVAGLRFRRVVENLRALRSMRPMEGAFRIVARVVLAPEDLPGVGRMTEAAVRMGADAVSFAASRRPGDPLAALERRGAFIEAARAMYEADTDGRIESLEPPHPLMADELLNLRGSHSDRYPGSDLKNAVGTLFRTACVMPWLGLAVAPNGAVHPCRRALEQGIPPLGNLHARPLARLWRDRPLRTLRGGVRASRWDGRVCAACRTGEHPALPYALDRDFCQELDSLLRGGSERSVRFPDRLRDREWGTIVLPLRQLWPWRGAPEPQLKVDGVPVGAVAGGQGNIAIRFLPDALPSGFHLVEVVDPSGRLLKARMVEKVR